MLTLHAKQPAGRDVSHWPAALTIREVKQRMCDTTGYEMERIRVRRTVNSDELPDEQTLAGAGFVDGDTLVSDLCSIEMEVTLVRDAGDLVVFTLYADGSNTVGELKQLIAARADGYPVEWQWSELLVPADTTQPESRYSSLVAANVDDEQPLSHYCQPGPGPNAVKRHMLVHRRHHPQPAQHTERDKAAQPDQLLRVLVYVTATNDLYELRALAWQPVVAARWLLAGIQVASFNSQRLSLRPPVGSPQPDTLPLSDDFATLQLMGVTDGAALQLDRSDVALQLTLPPDVVMHTQPLNDVARTFARQNRGTLHAQLSDTVGQLKVKLQQLTDMPADRMLFRFHRPLLVDVDDSLTLAQLGSEARSQTDIIAVKSQQSKSGKSTQLTVRLLARPAAQPPTVDQQGAVGLVQVGVRALGVSGRVHRAVAAAERDDGGVD